MTFFVNYEVHQYQYFVLNYLICWYLGTAFNILTVNYHGAQKSLSFSPEACIH